jgi:hypothetical protein
MYATVSFATACSHGLRQHQVEIKLSGSFNRKVHPSEELEDTMEQIWRVKLAQNPYLFNGTKFRLAKYIIRSHDHLVMHWGMTDYKTYLKTCSRPEIVTTLKSDGERWYGEADAFLSNKVGVAAVLLSKDNMITFLRRSKNVGAYPDMMDIPGGHPEPQSIGLTWEDLPCSPASITSPLCVQELFDSILTEAHEEVNVPLTVLAPPILIGVTLQGDAGTPSFAFVIQCSLDASAIATFYKDGPTDQYETTQLVFCPILDASISSMQLTPSAKGCISLYHEYVLACSSFQPHDRHKDDILSLPG